MVHTREGGMGLRVRRPENQFCAKERILVVLCREWMMSTGRSLTEKSALEGLGVDTVRCECEASMEKDSLYSS